MASSTHDVCHARRAGHHCLKAPTTARVADTEIVEALSYQMRDHRATMRLNEEVESVEEMSDGRVAANLVSKKRINADALLYAVGRQGNVERKAEMIVLWHLDELSAFR